MVEIDEYFGNVRVVISDEFVSGKAIVEASYQYYPFGMMMPGKNTGADYRFGFNGKEMDNDVGKGTGVQYDCGFRIYDARIAKFLSDRLMELI
jgi:RHS repeat-associated protein